MSGSGKYRLPSRRKRRKIVRVSLSLRFAPPPSKHFASKHKTKIPNPTKNPKSHNMSLSASVSHHHLQNILQARQKNPTTISKKSHNNPKQSLSASGSHHHFQNILQAWPKKNIPQHRTSTTRILCKPKHLMVSHEM